MATRKPSAASTPPPATTTAATATTPSKPRRRATADENADPNLPFSSPAHPSSTKKKTPCRPPAATNCPAAARVVPSPGKRARKIVAVKKRSGPIDFEKCREALRASQEEFYKKACESEAAGGEVPGKEADEVEADGEIQNSEDGPSFRNERGKNCVFSPIPEVSESECESSVRRSGPEPGSGRVKNLVEAFESLLSISGQNKRDAREEEKCLPSALSTRSSTEFLQMEEEIGRVERLFSSMDANLDDRVSLNSDSILSEAGGRRSKRNSTETMRSSWNKKLRTSLHPFKLRTEQRGTIKKEIFFKKVHEMLIEEDKKRVPIAQGLPWTTDEPECLLKPPVKERTEPLDVVLHSDVRATERAEFDSYVAERIKFAEQLRAERERQQKLEEEEELRRLRKELIPKAQPMPYFDRPFIPNRSTRPRTIPKEPRFHKRPVRTSCYKRLLSSSTRDVKLGEQQHGHGMSSRCSCSSLR